MLIFILRRLMQSLFVLLAVSLVVFFAVYAVGDPIELLVNAEASVAGMRCTMSSMAGTPCTNELPRSPCSAYRPRWSWCWWPSR